MPFYSGWVVLIVFVSRNEICRNVSDRRNICINIARLYYTWTKPRFPFIAGYSKQTREYLKDLIVIYVLNIYSVFKFFLQLDNMQI